MNDSVTMRRKASLRSAFGIEKFPVGRPVSDVCWKLCSSMRRRRRGLYHTEFGVFPCSTNNRPETDSDEENSLGALVDCASTHGREFVEIVPNLVFQRFRV